MKASRAMRAAVIAAAAMVAAGAVWADDPAPARRRHTTPLATAATQTQHINETKDDTSRINAAFRARSNHYHREDGSILYVDTVTGEEWIDSTGMFNVPKMKYSLLQGVDVGINIWDPVMRLFGQKHGLVGFNASVNLHNRYFPAVEIGLGRASMLSEKPVFRYSGSLAPYFKIGADYNFLYNSTQSYKWFAGLRYGFSSFHWSVDDVNPAPGYWGDVPPLAIPKQHATAGWIEFNLGLSVQLWRNISAGWRIIFHSLVHQTSNPHGKPWYTPGYGTSGIISGSFSFTYHIPLKERHREVPDTLAGTFDDTPLTRPDTIIP